MNTITSLALSAAMNPTARQMITSMVVPGEFPGSSSGGGGGGGSNGRLRAGGESELSFIREPNQAQSGYCFKVAIRDANAKEDGLRTYVTLYDGQYDVSGTQPKDSNRQTKVVILTEPISEDPKVDAGRRAVRIPAEHQSIVDFLVRQAKMATSNCTKKIDTETFVFTTAMSALSQELINNPPTSASLLSFASSSEATEKCKDLGRRLPDLVTEARRKFEPGLGEMVISGLGYVASGALTAGGALASGAASALMSTAVTTTVSTTAMTAAMTTATAVNTIGSLTISTAKFVARQAMGL